MLPECRKYGQQHNKPIELIGKNYFLDEQPIVLEKIKHEFFH
jgi:hypothetical protein